MHTKTTLAVALAVLLCACATSGLDPLVVEGHELHPSLATVQLDDESYRMLPRDVLPRNPHLSTDAGFIEAIARNGSQGRNDGEGIRAALFALYVGESELGIYGLEAASKEVADRIEGALLSIWAKNVSFGRVRIHRGEVLVVVFHDGVSAACWEAVNASVVERLSESGDRRSPGHGSSTQVAAPE